MQMQYFYYDMFKIISFLFKHKLISQLEKDDLKSMIIQSDSEIHSILQTIYQSNLSDKMFRLVTALKLYIINTRTAASPRTKQRRRHGTIDMWSICEEENEEDDDLIQTSLIRLRK